MLLRFPRGCQVISILIEGKNVYMQVFIGITYLSLREIVGCEAKREMWKKSKAAIQKRRRKIRKADAEDGDNDGSPRSTLGGQPAERIPLILVFLFHFFITLLFSLTVHLFCPQG